MWVKSLSHGCEDLGLRLWDPQKAECREAHLDRSTSAAEWEAEPGDSLEAHGTASLIHIRHCLKQGGRQVSTFEVVR